MNLLHNFYSEAKCNLFLKFADQGTIETEDEALKEFDKRNEFLLCIIFFLRFYRVI